jgi:hypothetical protein
VVHEKLWLKMYPDHNFGRIFDVRAIEQTFDIHDTAMTNPNYLVKSLLTARACQFRYQICPRLRHRPEAVGCAGISKS